MIRVLLFAGLREAAGVPALDLPVPPGGASVADAWDAACTKFPVLSAWTGRLAFAVNGTYAKPDIALSDGDEVAAIPPVSGG